MDCLLPLYLFVLRSFSFRAPRASSFHPWFFFTVCLFHLSLNLDPLPFTFSIPATQSTANFFVYKFENTFPYFQIIYIFFFTNTFLTRKVLLIPYFLNVKVNLYLIWINLPLPLLSRNAREIVTSANDCLSEARQARLSFFD